MDKRYRVAQGTLIIMYFLMALLLFEAVYYLIYLISNLGTQVRWSEALLAPAIILIILIYLRMPYIVTVKEDKVLEFKSIFSKKEIPIKDMEAVITNITRLSIIFRHKKGSIVMLNRIENRKELINTIRKKKHSLDTSRLK